MCIWRQIRPIHKDLMTNPHGDVVLFLNRLLRIYKKIYQACHIEDKRTRVTAADCINSEFYELINESCADGEGKRIVRYKKRISREGNFMTACRYMDGILPDNNPAENVNWRFTSIKNDGSGNRSEKGMDANSILFTVLATDKINGNSFFDHLNHSSSGDR